MGSLEVVGKTRLAPSKQAKKSVKPSSRATRSQPTKKAVQPKQARQAAVAKPKRAPKKGGK
jgi:hypothetical protein